MPTRRFLSPWSVEKQAECFVVRDHSGQRRVCSKGWICPHRRNENRNFEQIEGEAPDSQHAGPVEKPIFIRGNVEKRANTSAKEHITSTGLAVAEVESASSAIVKDQVVILVHGIRDFALWQTTIRSTLEQEGFKTEATNYGRFNLI